jgi:hypothetical protein
MNKRELEMLSVLNDLRDNYGAISVKAEFEAEGTRVDELLRLVDLARRADLNVALKIGGCEAIRDLMDCKQFGTEYIIAPMIETPYAIQKYIDAKNKVFTIDQQLHTEFLFNVETIDAFENIDKIISVASQENGVDGIVFGRVDFVGSLGESRNIVDSDKLNKYILDVARKCKSNQLKIVVGGAVSVKSIEPLKEIKDIYLSRFETRKIIFSSDAITNKNIISGLEKTIYFELLWLQNKQDYYDQIKNEDAKRIEMLQSRWEQVKKG